MLTAKQITDCAAGTLNEYGMGIVRQLQRESENYGPGNLVALMELFAQKLEALKAPGVVDVIDAKLGIGWTHKLAEALGATKP